MGRFAAKASRGKFASTVVTGYKHYLDNPEVAKQDNPVRNRVKSKPLYIIPFGLTVPAKVFVTASASGDAITAYKAAANTGGARFKEQLDIAGGESSFKLAHYHAARVQICTGVADTGTPKKSKTSGLPYKSYGGHSKSIPFGRKTGSTETEQQAFDVIKEAINPGGQTKATLITLRPEKIPSIQQ